MKYAIVNSKFRQAFSLTEVLIAIAILTVALVMVGVSFPVGIMMTTNVAERTTAAVVADEAFAKIRLYGVNTAAGAWNTPIVYDNRAYVPPGVTVVRQEWLPFESVAASAPSNWNDEFAYPSDNSVADRVYCWSALCKKEPDGSVRVIVFVCRKSGSDATLYPTNIPAKGVNLIPKPTLVFFDKNYDGKISKNDTLIVNMSGVAVGSSTLKMTIAPVQTPPVPDLSVYLNMGCFVLADDTGEIYRIVERTETPARTVTFDRSFVKKAEDADINASPAYRLGYKFWVVPPAVGSGKNPCIAVYQKVIKF